MLRIHFTAEDLARTRVGAGIGAAAEAYSGLAMLRDTRTPLPFQGWRSAVGRRLGEEARPLLALLPDRGPTLDLVTIAGNAPSIGEAVERLLGAPRVRLREELEDLSVRPADAPWVRSLMDADVDALRQLARALEACHRTAVAPYWDRAASHLDAVRAACARTLMEGGVERLLEGLCVPIVRWRAPVLEVRHPRDIEFRLGGRGLVIVPAVFMRREPTLFWDPGDGAAPPRLTVPTVNEVEVGAALWNLTGTTAQGALGALLGRTRAAALKVTVGGCNTTELARRLNVSLAAASQHATVLRNANLITTNRRGGAVLHSITALGIDLLASEGATPPVAPGRN
ncbi:ArsR/SmtB family transcription factor [Streptomyces avidinii]|uniref:DNA-binding transcriptional ArsR family regulator n=1 Tax=Streptomyces avidinii TaxID=1895 RepID=A0ABS4LF61_STRAV|nr:winged helix-turn-helix domain-containing protein [Streptomyces avidinii]MBP2040778.1 DNA-binding transcriptional ArsR family regulator [Streptomyces avidinii]GGZ16015.1 transcriptional regulator [Streptomyces avidinii]